MSNRSEILTNLSLKLFRYSINKKLAKLFVKAKIFTSSISSFKPLEQNNNKLL